MPGRPSKTAACIRKVSLAVARTPDPRIALEGLSGEEFAVKVTVRARSYNNGQKIWTADLHVVPFGEEVE